MSQQVLASYGDHDLDGERFSTDSSRDGGSNSVSGLVSTLVPALVTAVFLFTLFVVLRPRVRRVYMPRTFLGALSEQQKSPDLPNSYFGWIKPFWDLPDTYAFNHHSIDAYLFLRFWRTIILICLIGCPLTWIILMPIYGTANGGESQFDKVSYSNIESHEDANRLYAVALIAWIFLGFVMYLIGRECVYYVQLKQAFQLLPGISSRMSSRTVLFTNIPEEYCNEERLRQVFPSVKHIWMVTDTQKLQEAVDERQNVAMRLEKAEVKLSRSAVDQHLKEKERNKWRLDDEIGLTLRSWVDGKQRPKHKLKFLIGEKVDTIHWSRDRLEELSRQIGSGQKKHRDGEAKMRSAVFIEFDDVETAEAAFQNPDFKLPRGFKPRTIRTRPQEIIWSNLNMSNWQHVLRRYIVIAMICAMIVFWGVIIAFIGSLSNLDSWAGEVPVLEFITKLPDPVLGLITGLLPVILLSMIMSLVPTVIRLAFKFAGGVAASEVELDTQRWHFIFQFIQVFLVTTLSSGAAATVTKIVQDPSQATGLLAQNLPKASNFYLNYLVLQGLAVAPKQLLNGAKLAVYLILGFILDDTPRKVYNRYTSLPGIPWGKVYPKFTLLAVIAITYSCIAPLILIFALVGFCLLFLAFRYKVLYSVDTLGINTQGRSFLLAMKQLTTGVYVAELCLVGLFGISASTNSAAAGPMILMIIFLVLTAIYHIILDTLLIHLEKNLSREVATQRAANDDSEQTQIQDRLAGLARSAIHALPSAIDSEDKASRFLVRFFRPPTLPKFDDFLHAEVNDYGEKVHENAYLDPAISKSSPLLWIVHDNLGISQGEIEQSRKIIDITDDGAWWDERGKMRTVCDNQGEDDGTKESPIHRDRIPY